MNALFRIHYQIKTTTMKKVFFILIFIISGTVCFGQNSGIQIKHLHSAEGKQWKRYVRPDGDQVALSLEDDIFTFYSNKSFKYDHAGTVSQELNNARTKTWSYNETTNVVSWEFYLTNGTVKKYKAELTYIDEKRAVMNFSEDDKASTIVVLITDSFKKE